MGGREEALPLEGRERELVSSKALRALHWDGSIVAARVSH